MVEGPKFVWDISAGTILHLAGMLVAMTILYMKLVHRMGVTESRVSRLYVWVRELIRKTPGVDAAVIATANSDEESSA